MLLALVASYIIFVVVSVIGCNHEDKKDLGREYDNNNNSSKTNKHESDY
jgi:hypothetical protein